MKTYSGTVRNGAVTLPPDAHVRDGERVVLAVVSEQTAQSEVSLDRSLEDEDLEFIRACRGRIAQSMRSEDD
ncbi:hypothetical protein HQ560_14400 [bacterium]|nr:hypothetical protein [bacterium]